MQVMEALVVKPSLIIVQNSGDWAMDLGSHSQRRHAIRSSPQRIPATVELTG